MAYRFGTISEERMKTLEKDLQLVMRESLKYSAIDFGIAEAHRPVKRQQELYAQGRTKPGKIVTNVDGVRKKGDHNYFPSKGVDIYAWVNREVSWEERDILYLGGVIDSTARRLKAEGKIKSDITWGGNWDSDGEIITDQTLQDLVHFGIS